MVIFTHPEGFWLCRKLEPPIPAGAPIKVVGRTDSNAAAYAMSQWLQQSGNGTWRGGVNKTLPLPPKAKAVSGSGSVVTDYIGKTPGAIGYVEPCMRTCVEALVYHFGVSLDGLGQVAPQCAPAWDLRTLREN